MGARSTSEATSCDRCGTPAPSGFEIVEWASIHPDRIRCPSCTQDDFDDDEDDGDLVKLPDGSYGVAPRDRDLPKAAVVSTPPRRSTEGVTSEQARLRREWAGVARDKRELHGDDRIVDWAVGRREAMVLGRPTPISKLEDKGPDAKAVAKHQRFIAERERPLKGATSEIIADAIEKEAVARQQSLKRCKAAFSKRGRPSATLEAHRASVREVLLPIHASGASYTALANVLDCTARAVETLLKR
jgi:hypothetical protein